MKIILPTSIILAAIILIIGLFAFKYYEDIQLEKSCEKIIKNYTIEDVPKKIVDMFTLEVQENYPPYDIWAYNNPQGDPDDWWGPFNEMINKKISKYLKSQEERNIEECILNNS